MAGARGLGSPRQQGSIRRQVSQPRGPDGRFRAATPIDAAAAGQTQIGPTFVGPRTIERTPERDAIVGVGLLALGVVALVGLLVLAAGWPAMTSTSGAASRPTIGPGAAIIVMSPLASAPAAAAPTPELTIPPTIPATGPPSPRPTAAPTPSPKPAARTAGTPAQAVVDFYLAVVRHDWPRAISLWSPAMQQRYPPQEYLIDRFKATTRIWISRLRTVAEDDAAGTARVALTLTEYRTVEPSPRTFVGSWDLIRRNGRWLLDSPHF